MFASFSKAVPRSLRRPPAPISKGPLAFAVLLGAASALSAQTLPITVGDRYEAVISALKAKSIAFEKEPKSPTGPLSQAKVTYSNREESVTLEFSLWPDDRNAPPAAYSAGSPDSKHLVLTHLRSVAPGSEARRNLVRAYERDGQHWAYMTSQASNARPPEDRARYTVAAYLQLWRENPNRKAGGRVPSVTFLFQAARPVGSPPGNEPTVLDIHLENPYKPRRF